MATSREELLREIRRRSIEAEISELSEQARIQESLPPRQLSDTPDRNLADRLREFNVGVARSLGLPVDAAGSIARVSGLTSAMTALGAPSEFIPGSREVEQFGGGTNIQRGLAAIGSAPEPGSEGTDFEARLLQNLGTIAVPSAATLRAAQTGGRAVSRIAGDITAATGATVGGQIGREVAPETPAVHVLLELVGAFTVPGTVAVARGAGNLTDRGLGFMGDFSRASRRTQDLASDPFAAAARLETSDTLPGVSPAARTGETNLIALENTITSLDPSLKVAFETRAAEVAAEARRLARFGGTPEELINYLNRRALVLAETARRRITRLRPRSNQRQLSEATRNILDDALEKELKLEKSVWKRIDRTIPVKLGRSLRVFGRDLKSLSRVNQDDVPDELRKFLGTIENGKFKRGELGIDTTLGELRDLRTKVIGMMSAERAKNAPNGNRIRILNNLQEALLKDADVVVTQGGDNLRGAIEFSRELNIRFRRGIVGDLLGFEFSRAERLSPAATLETVLAASGETQAQAARHLLQAAPESARNIKDYIKLSFISSATDKSTNLVVPERGRSFITQNEALLDEFPGLRRQLEGTINAQTRVDEILGVKIPGDLSPMVRNKSAAGLVLQGNPNEAIARVLRTGSVKQAISLRNRVLKDPDALAGLKASLGEELLARARTGRLDIADEPIISGSKLQQEFADNLPMIREILSPTEVRRFRTIIRTFEAQDKVRRTGTLSEGIIADRPAKLLNILSRIGAAQVGRIIAGKTGGGTVQTPGIFSNEARDALNKITVSGAQKILVQSIQDERLFKALLVDLRRASPSEISSVVERIRPYLVIPAATALRDEEPLPPVTIFGVEF